jgi:hypothetical protein
VVVVVLLGGGHQVIREGIVGEAGDRAVRALRAAQALAATQHTEHDGIVSSEEVRDTFFWS